MQEVRYQLSWTMEHQDRWSALHRNLGNSTQRFRLILILITFIFVLSILYFTKDEGIVVGINFPWCAQNFPICREWGISVRSCYPILFLFGYLFQLSPIYLFKTSDRPSSYRNMRACVYQLVLLVPTLSPDNPYPCPILIIASPESTQHSKPLPRYPWLWIPGFGIFTKPLWA